MHNLCAPNNTGTQKCSPLPGLDAVICFRRQSHHACPEGRIWSHPPFDRTFVRFLPAVVSDPREVCAYLDICAVWTLCGEEGGGLYAPLSRCCPALGAHHPQAVFHQLGAEDRGFFGKTFQPRPGGDPGQDPVLPG